MSPKDSEPECEKLVSKLLRLKLWPSPDETKQWQRNITELPGGKILCVSQFTLYANIRKGAKPDFHGAEKGERAKSLYDLVLSKLKSELNDTENEKVFDGQFGAMMDVALINDGPVTIEYDSEK